MPREILPQNPTPVAQDLATAAPAATVAATPAQLDLPDRDALAGALPAWDLLPASPFVRRVK
ncbi:MAG: hypothetical protein RR718_08630 [Comamonas sp.]